METRTGTPAQNFASEVEQATWRGMREAFYADEQAERERTQRQEARLEANLRHAWRECVKGLSRQRAIEALIDGEKDEDAKAILEACANDLGRLEL